jgi:hypothetical protein
VIEAMIAIKNAFDELEGRTIVTIRNHHPFRSGDQNVDSAEHESVKVIIPSK